jgi:acetoin utilization deacetylase AcuC-like enzyme
VHRAPFVETLERLRGQEGFIDPDTYVSRQSVDAARAGAGGCVELVDRVLGESGDALGVALIRPPGHHATPGRAMGFCLLNGVAVAAAHARARGLGRVAIVDWDVHHGNGTQDAFWTDPHVLYASLHQWPFYPGTGAARDIGEGEGRGYTLNIPLSAHATDATYATAFEEVLLPVLDEYKPELLLVSAGFDASARDPLAQMDLSANAFGWMAHALGELARKHCGGRIVLVLEGGYDLVSLEAGLGATLDALVHRKAPELSGRVRDDGDIARARRHAAKTWPSLGVR